MSGERRALAPMAAWNAATWIAAALYGFVVTRIIVAFAGEPAYGLWATVSAFRGFILLFDSGLAYGVNRDAALGGGSAERIRASRRIYVGLGLAAIALFAVAASFPAVLLGLEAKDAELARGLTLVLGVETAAALVTSPLHAILRGRQRFAPLATAVLAQTALGLALVVVLTQRYGVVGAACAALVSRTVVAAALILWMRRARLLPGRETPVAPGTARTVIAFAAPLWLAALGTQLGAGTDVPIVGGFHGAAAAGHYALGALLPGVGAGLLFAVMGASFPRMVGAGETDRRRMAAALLFMATFLAGIGFGFIAFHAGDILDVWVGRAPTLAVTVAMIASASWLLNSPTHVLSSLAIAGNQHGVLGKISLAEAVVSLGVSVMLAAWWSPAGPAVGTLAVVSVTNVLVVPALLRKRLGLTWSGIARPSVTGAGLGLAGAAAVWALVGVLHAGPLVVVAAGATLTVVFAAIGLDLTVRGESQVRRAILVTLRGGWSVKARQRREAAAERKRLAELRAKSPVWKDDPLVTVRIATYNRGRLVADRAIASALAQTYRNIEVLVVGDHCDDATAEAVLSVKDPRVRFINLPERGRYPQSPRLRWMVAGAAPMNHALDVLRGDWIAPLDDDDEFTPDHVEVLLAAAKERGLEFVYGKADMEGHDGTWTPCGEWPLRHGGIAHVAAMWSTRIGFRHENESWRLDEPGDWNLWKRMRAAGVVMGFVDRVVSKHYREAREVKRVAPFWCGEI